MDQSNTSFLEDKGATKFFKKILDHFSDMRKSFPKVKYDGTMDFVCQTDNGEYVMVEMQNHIKNVIGINILGGGNIDLTHWTDTPDQYVRYYKVEEQLHTDTQGLPQRYIPGLELFQYSIMNAPDNGLPDSEKQDWITFFKKPHRMNEEEVATRIKTPEVLQVFQKAKLDTLPRDVRKQYFVQDLEFDRYSDGRNR
jgi:hypothetical protein